MHMKRNGTGRVKTRLVLSGLTASGHDHRISLFLGVMSVCVLTGGVSALAQVSSLQANDSLFNQFNQTSSPGASGSSALEPAMVGSDPNGASAPPPVATPSPRRKGSTVSGQTPVTFTADHLTYDRDGSLVSAEGHVEAWQGDHVLRADKVTYDRNTNIAAASGNVVLLEPDGEVLFSDYAELSQGMKDGVMKNMRALLKFNGRLVANGMRRTDGKVNDMSRVLYTTCNLCLDDPKKPPFWQIRAFTGTQDLEEKKIEYQDAVMEIYGIPVLYLPYMSHPDPSVKRKSGFMVPGIGQSGYLGVFARVPYYLVIDDSSDVTLTATLPSQTGPQLQAYYRKKFNSGDMQINVAAAYVASSSRTDRNAYYDPIRPGFQGLIFAKGEFVYDDTWRYGFNLNNATSAAYLRDYHISGVGTNVLSNNIYLEGFGQGSYTRLNALSYQGISGSFANSTVPYVLPHYVYEYAGQPDSLGGHFSLRTDDFSVLREKGVSDQRASLSLNWDRPAIGRFGDLWKFTLHGDTVAYNATGLNQQPVYAPYTSTTDARALPQAAVEVRLPLTRSAGQWGTQVVEPIAQLIVAPNTGGGGYRYFPNEDSLVTQFTDANLFSLNRFNGLDRMEGGIRANVGLHASWKYRTTMLDGLVGQSYRTHRDDTFMPGLGLSDRASDIVGRVSLSGIGYDLTTRGRFDHRSGRIHYGEAVASFGPSWLRANVGYLYTAENSFYDLTYAPGTVLPVSTPAYQLVTTPRNEVMLGLSTHYEHWRLSAYARRNMEAEQMVALGGDIAYENECFILAMRLYKRYTSILNDTGNETIMFSLTFKTLGSFGFRAF
ncbi:Organic solvent tolerance protein [Granulibacter bethesdensis]|uniref:LPS-assembly protein LptD n=2 Tax=Granulibacter bethesdensis TaxID=364410 RepID=A0AAC9P9E1_9PROT|nr:Organic solvent tolerance protein [Granulibacter bethesdensis]APH63108.1 Organic solvent tolerance protein [Granulibacter bethesdensis]